VGSLPRGRCPVCIRDVALRKGGLLRQHTMVPSGKRQCRGSGRAPSDRALDEPPPAAEVSSAKAEWLEPAAVREALGVTQVELAAFLNVGTRSVQRAEQSGCSPSGSTFVLWHGLVRLALNPRPLVIGGEAKPLRRWLAQGSLPVELRRRLWAEVLAE